jgi:hypothetical protein
MPNFDFSNDADSSTSSELFFSESEDSIDVVLNEQDVIIDEQLNKIEFLSSQGAELRKENEKLKHDLINLKNNMKDHLVECMRNFTEVYNKIKYDVF